MCVFGRALTTAAGLTLVVGLGGAQAQELSPEVHETAQCGGVVLTMSIIRHVQTDDEIHYFHGLLLAEAAASAIHKELHDELPVDDVLAAIEEVIDKSSSDVVARNQNFRSDEEYDKLYREALSCYEDLLSFMSERGLEILTGYGVLEVYIRTLMLHINYVEDFNEIYGDGLNKQ